MANTYKESPHIGEILKKYCSEKRIYKAAWARHQSVRKSTVTGYFKKKSMQISTLFTISQVLKYNFIRQVADMLPPEYPPHAANPLQAEVEALKKENEKLKDEIAVLKGVIAMKR
jgi:hypothetical protein